MYENQLETKEVYFSGATFCIPVKSYPVYPVDTIKSDQLYVIDHEYFFLSL